MNIKDMKLIRLIPARTKFNFLKLRKLGYVLSVGLVLFSTSLLVSKGFNFGIDFSGGVAMDVKKINSEINISYLRSELSSLNPEIQEIGHSGEIFDIRIAVKEDQNPSDFVNEVKSILGEGVEYRNTEVVGPKVGGELIRKGVWAVVLSLLAISFYIWIRFDIAFSIGALTALAHDIILTLGMFSLLQLEFSLATVAAILTIAGYSINDTVVSYDKLRENIKKHKKKSPFELINWSLNETFSRTIMTSLTTLIAVLCIFVFGGEVLKGFSSAMLFGVVVGTYSSIFIAMPLLLNMDIKQEVLDNE
ncbi:MAG: protein translocase subunit SecF [Alphaproteobacteria bacterium]|jgi:preprotein translocase SecF subunit|nr:protein translocase subunit SecF [Alphaproteobacteria bacterium]